MSQTDNAIHGRVLIIAGSDSGGGAGIQADIKSVTALRGFAMTAITALTAQNTMGVYGVHAVPPDFIAQQMELVLTDLGADCAKTGMLHSAPVIETVVETLDRDAPGLPLVADPVMIAKGGARLLEPDAAETLKSVLVPRATLVTPNLPEAGVIAGLEVTDLDGMRRAAESILAMGPQAVLVKGGHLPGDKVYDLLATPEGETLFEADRIDTPHTHGTGCTLASAIATGIAQGMNTVDAVARARDYVLEAIRLAPGFGRGHGPLDHGHTFKG